MGNIGWMELIVIFCVVLLFFGAKRIPEVARALGKASREFKNARDSVVGEVKENFTEEDPQNFILMQASAANVAGQIASVVAGGLVLGLLM